MSALLLDPAGTPTVGTTAFVRTADGYIFLVKGVGERFYTNDDPQSAFTIVSIDPTSHIAQIDADPPGPDPGNDPPLAATTSFSTRLLYSDFQAQLSTAENTPGDLTPPDLVTGASGVRIVYTGRAGSNGHAGALFVPPGTGGGGADGPALNYTNTINISTNNQIGIEAGSIGGKGGKGGNSYASFWSGRDGGDGGAGGTVSVTNSGGIQVATTGTDMHGIFAYSRSGAAGAGGTGYAAPGGGTGGHSSDGGAVTVDNHGIVRTTGAGAYGIFGLSVSNNGGGGGSQWGIVGEAGSGGYGGNGGTVSITNSKTGSIFTSGTLAHGIVAESIGGSGGSSGTSGNLLVSLNGNPDNGGDGSTVFVTNKGLISTTGAQSRGIFAQSIGGGGGSGGGSGGLISLGGAGSNGGSAGNVAVRNSSSGTIVTGGQQSDGIFAQSVGGSGGSGSNSFGLVALGGRGAKAGNGGAVIVENYGTLTTSGETARGIVAQSIGGGGGDGGSSGGLVSVGGSGDGGGIGSTVTVKHGGTITTQGVGSTGILAQSIGGGGGSGGSAGSVSAFSGVSVGGTGGGGGKGGVVDVTLQGKDVNEASRITTTGDRAAGILAQSVGGGGGVGGGVVQVTGGFVAAVSVAVGGSGGKGGEGGTVTMSRGPDFSTVQTSGNDSPGLFLQSVGGGGGNGGYAVSIAASGGPAAGSLSLAVGGEGGSGGRGGVVRVGSFTPEGNTIDTGLNGTILTGGIRSPGLLVQSVGGGGGNGGFSVSAGASGAVVASGAIGIGLGGSGGSGGNGGAVSVATQANVTTLSADSTGMLVQSVGGGGGNGAFNVTAAGSAAGTGGGAVSVGLGGSGGSGGNAERVISDVTGTISTSGNNSAGLLAQSVGGGGGNGGFNVSGAVAGAGTGSLGMAVGLGGSGGSGGTSDAVRSTLTGDVTTQGNFATGVTAQSIGGGGGNGGFNVSGTISGAKDGTAGVSIGIGGSGGGGGFSLGTVDNTVRGNVTTFGLGSGGVLAQSTGGGGGNGGFNVSGTITAAQTGSGAISVGIGGAGGLGGDSAAVLNRVTGDVITAKAGAFGILAQSVGGGGGSGGLNVSGSISAAKTTAGAIAVGIGGAGGGGGNAASVLNTVTGYVQTNGARSAGITTQSLGGGGGIGGLNVSGTLTASKSGSGGLAVGVGGLGGNGGYAVDATSHVTGGVFTSGIESPGILTQSVGGGGGKGGINVTGAVNLSKDNGGSLGVGVGGFGGGGGNAADVTSTVTTTPRIPLIITMGRDSSGVVAQSIGGGGGSGGLNVTGAVNLSGKSGAAIGVGVGGFGGGAGNAGKVVLNTTGDIATYGDDSTGLFAQSVGGAGGNGATNVTGSLSIIKPSGGAAGTTVAASIGVGGFGGGGGRAGDVAVDYNGTIVAVPRTLITPAVVHPTTGAVITPAVFSLNATEGAHGLVAQSIGGGGGHGGVNVSGGVSYAAGQADGHALLVGVGGFGGGGGNAGNVDVNVTGSKSITAYGNGRSALLASSVGGSGGIGGLNVTAGFVSDSPLIVGVGGLGGNGGTGGNVRVSAASHLFTSSQNSNIWNSAGLMAQSLGGGGGDGGLNVSGAISISKEAELPSITFGIGGFGGAGAVSGNVNATHKGNIITSGGWTHGLFAQSIAGGGGNGALNVSGEFNWADSKNSGGKTDLSIVAGLGGHGGAGANAGTVTVVSEGGTITTSGDYSRGIFAQSIGGGGGTGGMNVSGIFAKNSSPISLGVGGFGSGGGHAGSVTVTRGTATNAAGKIMTDGVGAVGIEASSIGGGGGDAGMNFMVGISLAGGGAGEPPKPRQHPKHTGVDESVFVNFDKVLTELEAKQGKFKGNTDPPKGSAFAAQVAIGGAGGDAGNGGATTLNNLGDVETRGDSSHGIMAQSIGGGGGNATLNLGLMYEGKSDQNKGFNLAVGGAPGNAGNGSTVTVTNAGAIETYGRNSYGVLAQSIGGGGGNAGFDFPLLITGGQVGISIGRTGGSGGSAGNVSLTSTGDVTTHGSTSYGLLAQSVGNGGGNSSATSVSLSVPKSGETPARDASIAVGLEGGVGGVAGNVNLVASGSVRTGGENSHAIFAQSVGGGGGNGGMATGIAFKSALAALSVGGEGGQGGAGGNVDIASSAEVRTASKRSAGILAQSVGGAGGTGGSVISGGVQSKGDSALISVGGTGGTGMSSGNVTVGNSGIIITNGEESHGVLAQSIGGGGGTGGLVINEILNLDATKATQLGISVGGSGGEGARSGDVAVTNSGGIGTSNISSIGIFAQSIGGGGGNASTVITGAITGTGAGNKINVGIGGTGGTGGAGGNVYVGNQRSGQIITLNDNSPGILAMSVGGGGGTGSTTITSNVSLRVPKATDTTSVAFSLGGSGGTGGTGGNVTVENAGAITTFGNKAHGIVALSIGGGGGGGGVSIAGDLALGGHANQSKEARTTSLSIGGMGGDGNRGGNVKVANSGSIEVHGDNAYGIYAQSVGGGGGDGGFAASASRNLFADPRSQASLLNIAVGGSGGTGGDSGNVLVQHAGSITSYGDHSYGIFAQAVAGGGGSVGTSISNPFWTAVDLGISAILGARDGAAGQAGRVTVNTTGDITMHGSNSQALFMQAVSGGGGDLDLFLNLSQSAVGLGRGGFVLPTKDSVFAQGTTWVKGQLGLGADGAASANGAPIDATHVGSLNTSGHNSVASLTQSIGGGGGNAGAAVVLDQGGKIDLEVALGAKQTSNSSGGDITLNRNGNVTTSGNQSQGVSVQSVGGGGGRMLLDVKTLSALPGSSTSTATVSLGADPSFANHGGNLGLALSGDTVTAGNYSPGLVLQSIGAGGGQAYLSGLESVTANIGAAEGSTGNGGNIRLSNTGVIATFGELSDGIVLQSIGGGGGYVITDVKPGRVAVNARGNNAGSGGNIDFTQAGDIVAFGDRSRGVVAQSIGGGGGIVDGVFAGSAGGDGAGGSIALRFGGNVVASGLGSTAIFAQSLGRTTGNINILLAPGTTVLGGIDGAGVAIDGGGSNSLLNGSVLTTMSGIGGMAVSGTTGNDLVDNFGTIVGSIDLGGGANALVNRSTAWLSSGTSIDLGGGIFTNAGTLDPGAASLTRTMLTGRFVQQGTPTWLVDIGEIGNADGLFASGRADFGNSVTTLNLRGRTAPTGSGTYTLFTAADGLSGAQFRFGSMFGEMPIGQTFTFDVSDTDLKLNLQPSSGAFYWNGAVSNIWSDAFVDGKSNWTRQPGADYIYGTPGAASDVTVGDDAVSMLGADFTIGSLTGTGVISLGGNVLTTGANGTSTTWAGTMGGDGNVFKVGAGTFTLTGSNPVFGTTTVAGGQLRVDGWLGGRSLRVLNGALLGGNGVVPTLTIEGGGTLSPGTSIGTLFVKGDLEFEPGSFYSVETTASASDLTWVTGSLAGGGAAVHVRPGGTDRYHPITSYGIVGARGASQGIFSSVISDASYLDPSLQYHSDGVYLTLRRNDVDFRSAGTRGNQSSAALALNGLVRTATGEMADVINSVYDLPDVEAVRTIGSMTGVAHQYVALGTLFGAQAFVDVNMTRLAHVTGGVAAPVVNRTIGSVQMGTVPKIDRHGAWFSGIGGLTRLAGGDGDPSARLTDQGFAVGYDATIGTHLVVGASGGDSWPDLELETVSDRSQARMRHVGIYGRYARGGSRFSGLVGASRVDQDTERVVLSGFRASTARAVYEGDTLFSRVEYGHMFSFARGLSVEPQVMFQYARVTLDGFGEDGAGVLSLVGPDRWMSSERAFLGGRIIQAFGSATAELRTAWAHEFNPMRTMPVRFSGDTADNGFTLASPVRFGDSAMVGATFAGHVYRKLTFQVSVDGSLGSAIDLWTGSIGIRAQW